MKIRFQKLRLPRIRPVLRPKNLNLVACLAMRLGIQAGIGFDNMKNRTIMINKHLLYRYKTEFTDCYFFFNNRIQVFNFHRAQVK